jgi:membrane fusion protein, multidrug efflux system
MALKDNRDQRDHQTALRDKPSPSIESPSIAPVQDRLRSDELLLGRFAALRRHPYIAGLVAIVILAVIGTGVAWWLNARHYVTTDDAFIDARTVQIGPQISGYIVAVPVTDNQSVEKGTLLARIDPSDYKTALQQAQAQLSQAKASVANFDAQIDAQTAKIAQAKTQVTQAQAALTYSEQQYTRAQDLLKRGAGTQQQAQQTFSDLVQKRAVENFARANETAAEKELPVLRAQHDSAAAQVDAAQAAVDRAEIDLDRTTINAPEAGRITNLTAAVGNLAQPGQSLMALVPRNVWITANFKETDLVDMRAGQPVDIEVDAYPGKTFHGHIDSIQAGSGAAFSLLPPENATGNYVKVVQRVPVKIVFNDAPDVYLGPGMSVMPRVKVQ